MAASSNRFAFSKRPRQATGILARVGNLLSDVWDIVGPALMVVLGPVGRFLVRPARIRGRQCNPLRTDCFLWGREDPRFWHGMSFGAVLNVLFIFLLTVRFGCQESYFLPEGGGADSMAGAQPIVKKTTPKKIQKKVRYSINPFAPVMHKVPSIDEYTKEIDEQLREATMERYAVDFQGSGPGTGKLGRGKGQGAGFGAGRWNGLIRFIRIKYNGGNWDNNMGKGADWNILLETRIRVGWKVARESEYRTIEQLDNFKMYASPPMVYMTGQQKIGISDREAQMLRRYLLDKHGMIVADASGPGWAGEFRKLMRRVLPEVQPIPIPLDDEIFRKPYRLSSFPYISPHERPQEATGWKVQGRWVAFLHPGDMADGWKDGHSGSPRDVWEATYQLGINLLYYSHDQYAGWIEQTKGKQ